MKGSASKKITIERDTSQLSKEEIQKMVEEAEIYKMQDEKIHQRILSKNDLENFAYQIRNSLDDEKLANFITKQDRDKIEQTIKNIVDWLDENPNASKEEIDEKKNDLESLWKPIMMKAYQQQPAQNAATTGDKNEPVIEEPD